MALTERPHHQEPDVEGFQAHPEGAVLDPASPDAPTTDGIETTPAPDQPGAFSSPETSNETTLPAYEAANDAPVVAHDAPPGANTIAEKALAYLKQQSESAEQEQKDQPAEATPSATNTTNDLANRFKNYLETTEDDNQHNEQPPEASVATAEPAEPEAAVHTSAQEQQAAARPTRSRLSAASFFEDDATDTDTKIDDKTDSASEDERDTKDVAAPTATVIMPAVGKRGGDKTPQLSGSDAKPAPESKKWWQKPAAKVAAVLGVAGIAAGGIGVATSGSNPEQVTAGPAPTADGGAPTTSNKPEPSSPEGTAVAVEKDPTVGVIQTGRILPTDEVFNIPRPNNDYVKIPKIRSSKDPAVYTEAILALLAGVGTTSNQQEQQRLLDELLPDNPTGQRGFIEMFNTIKNKVPESRESYGDTYQVSMFDDPENPAEFTQSSDGTSIKLSGGKLYMSPYVDPIDDPKWQSSETHRKDYTYVYEIDELKIELKTDSTGKLVPSDIYLHYYR